MRCRRICRELLWLSRFGELGPSSAPHLDHLAGCRGCRDEVGFDRALVQQLRVALAERVEGENPSPNAWDVIRQRAQAPERGMGAYLHARAAAFAARLRTATAISAMALAGIIATSTNVTVTHPEAGSAETEVVTSAAGERFEREALVPRPRGGPQGPTVGYVAPATPSDPEAAFLVSAALTGTAPAADTSAPAGDPAVEGGVGQSTIQSAITLGALVSQSTPIDPADAAPTGPVAAEAGPTEETSAGEPF